MRAQANDADVRDGARRGHHRWLRGPAQVHLTGTCASSTPCSARRLCARGGVAPDRHEFGVCVRQREIRQADEPGDRRDGDHLVAEDLRPVMPGCNRRRSRAEVGRLLLLAMATVTHPCQRSSFPRRDPRAPLPDRRGADRVAHASSDAARPAPDPVREGATGGPGALLGIRLTCLSGGSVCAIDGGTALGYGASDNGVRSAARCARPVVAPWVSRPW